MRLAWLEATGFRTYRELRFEPDAGINVLVGPNGVGKTNLLEAIGYLARLGSFRGAPDDAVISDDSQTAVLRAGVDHHDRTSLLEVEVARDRRRRVQVNRGRLGRSEELADHLRVVVFQPDDLDIAKRSPSYRRAFIDDAAVLLWPAAKVDQAEYERAIRHRNALLKQMGTRADRTTLGVWNERVAATGAVVAYRRAAAISELERRAAGAYRTLAGGPAEVSSAYRSSWETDLGGGVGRTGLVEEWQARLWAALEAAERLDMDRRMTTVGPHRDDPAWLIDGRDARLHASQGEQRTLVLALRLAQQAAVRAVAGGSPVLLLDDVFSELDRDRAGALAAALPNDQAFITTAREDEVPMEGRRWRIVDGGVE